MELFLSDESSDQFALRKIGITLKAGNHLPFIFYTIELPELKRQGLQGHFLQFAP